MINDSIIIKEAHKGPGVIVLDEDDYLAEEKNNMIMRKVTRNLENMLKVHLKKLE